MNTVTFDPAHAQSLVFFIIIAIVIASLFHANLERDEEEPKKPKIKIEKGRWPWTDQK